MPVHYEIYTPTLGPSIIDGQIFVDRAEDLVIEQQPITIQRNQGSGLQSMDTIAEVHLHADAGVASYHSSGDASSGYITLTDMETGLDTNHLRKSGKKKGKSSGFSMPKLDIFAKNRKSSLQVDSGSSELQNRRAGYERMNMYSSENGIAESSFSTLPSSTRHTSRTTNHQTMDLSHDNLYESTVTITSSVRSESMETNLETVEDEANRIGDSAKNLDLLMASLEDFNKTMSLQQRSDDEVITSPQAGNDVYAKVIKVRSSTDDEMKRKEERALESQSYTVTCTAELKDKTRNSLSASPKSSSSSSSSSSQSSSRSSRSPSPVNMETTLSFDDTLKHFENFVVKIDDVTEPERGLDFDDRQTDRGEQVIKEDKPSFTRKQTGNVQQGTNVTSRAVKTTTAHKLTINVSNGNSGATTTTGFTDDPESSIKETKLSRESFNGRNLDAELNQSIHALLSGINVETSEWSAIKDATRIHATATTSTDDTIYEVFSMISPFADESWDV